MAETALNRLHQLPAPALLAVALIDIHFAAAVSVQLSEQVPGVR